MKLKKVDISRKFGIKPYAITRAVKSGNLVADELGLIDDTNPENAEFFAQFATESDDSDDIAELSVQKIKAEIRYKNEAADAFRIKRLQSIGVLVEKQDVIQTLGKLNSEIRNRILTIPGSTAPQILAMVRSGESEINIENFLAKEIKRALDDALRSINE